MERKMKIRLMLCANLQRQLSECGSWVTWESRGRGYGRSRRLHTDCLTMMKMRDITDILTRIG